MVTKLHSNTEPEYAKCSKEIPRTSCYEKQARSGTICMYATCYREKGTGKKEAVQMKKTVGGNWMYSMVGIWAKEYGGMFILVFHSKMYL